MGAEAATVLPLRAIWLSRFLSIGMDGLLLSLIPTDRSITVLFLGIFLSAFVRVAAASVATRH